MCKNGNVNGRVYEWECERVGCIRECVSGLRE